jgi:hypothetical protein
MSMAAPFVIVKLPLREPPVRESLELSKVVIEEVLEKT